ncbi:MAG: hypothetical protein COC23_08565 [Hyphomicrobiales bacterium]|nr:MAG: hypothetical protein COC23_08565 [Hyphomicrobiales bacterium]
MNTIALTISIVLFPIALIHLGWSFGLIWPAKSEQELSNMVVGAKDATKMPGKLLTRIVALAIAAAACWPLMWQGLIWYPHAVPQTLVWLGMWILTSVFLLRGAISYLPNTFAAVQPFYRLNRIIYSPLCLGLGTGFFLLVTNPL